MQKGTSLLKYQLYLYNHQSNDYDNHRSMKLQCNNKLFPSLNIINKKPSPYGNMGIQRYNDYRSDTKLDPGIDAIRRIPCSFHAFTEKLSLP